MIKANELRCGNRVQFAEKMQPHGAYGEPGPFMTVYGIVEQVKMAQSSILPGPAWEQIWLESFLGPIDPEKLSGIPLTPQILEKCGFAWSDHEYIPASYSRNGIDEELCYSGKELYFYGNSGPIGQPLKTLHQLQNAFFALTGEELTYTP